MLEAVVEAVAEVLEAAGGREVAGGRARPPGRVGARLGRRDGRALTPMIVWQDKRQEELLEEIDAARSLERSGLPLDPYFSAGKLAWLLATTSA